jgi:hypothetical protein
MPIPKSQNLICIFSLKLYSSFVRHYTTIFVSLQYFYYNKFILYSEYEGTTMEDKLLRYTLRVDRVLFRKFRYIAESEGRSANKEIEQYMKRAVAEYEKGNGKIKFEE